mmetsp:Transcript_1516/g.3760  ORF Transcript_1516/g.3760 Transcript_1516/m.3760 type:complete len:309 (-) Transcript_1516:930-1856(-)
MKRCIQHARLDPGPRKQARNATRQPASQKSAPGEWARGWFHRAFKCDVEEHPRLAAFRALADWARRQNISLDRALYPGSFTDVVPAMVVPSVTFVDSYAGARPALAKFFVAAPDLLASRDRGSEPLELRFHAADFTSNISEVKPGAGFDLLISLSASSPSGCISKVCADLVRPGGLLAVNDDHGDACVAFSMTEAWLLVGFVDGNGIMQEDTSKCFLSRRGKRRKEAADYAANAGKPLSRRPLAVVDVGAQFFVFQRKPCATHVHALPHESARGCSVTGEAEQLRPSESASEIPGSGTPAESAKKGAK